LPLIPEVTMNQVFENSFPIFECRVCALESVREDDIETARSKVAQRILEICRCLRLRQCGLNIQILLDLPEDPEMPPHSSLHRSPGPA
jgi:hypothetical protein